MKCNPKDAAFSNAVDYRGNPSIGYGLTLLCENPLPLGRGGEDVKV